jgi:tRNA 2-thiouridine synthesizing protein D
VNFSLLVQQGPVGNASSLAAFRFAQAALAAGHTVFRVFFFRDGALHATRLERPATGEPDLPRQWQELARAHGIDLVACVGSALRRGVVDAREAQRAGLGDGNLREGFELAGLGQLVEATLRSDRVLSFGG